MSHAKIVFSFPGLLFFRLIFFLAVDYKNLSEEDKDMIVNEISLVIQN